jgi:hypothetical protein
MHHDIVRLGARHETGHNNGGKERGKKEHHSLPPGDPTSSAGCYIDRAADTLLERFSPDSAFTLITALAQTSEPVAHIAPGHRLDTQTPAGEDSEA